MVTAPPTTELWGNANGITPGFTGRTWDASADLYNYRPRWYDPGLGRFLSEDPASFEAGDANLYRYGGNMPLSGTDASGMFFDKIGDFFEDVFDDVGDFFEDAWDAWWDQQQVTTGLFLKTLPLIGAAVGGPIGWAMAAAGGSIGIGRASIGWYSPAQGWGAGTVCANSREPQQPPRPHRNSTQT